jgi:hypothetical protein
MQPGAVIDLDEDGAASLAAGSERAVAHWTALEGRGTLLPVEGPVPLGEVKAAFEKYRQAASTGLFGLPGLLERAGRIRPLSINLLDPVQLRGQGVTWRRVKRPFFYAMGR